MTKIYVRASNRAPGSVAGDARAPQPGAAADATATKPPSFLAQAKADLTDLVEAQTEHATITAQNAPAFVDVLWPFVSKRCASSYWNGVRDGASGRVKPKERRGRNGGGE